MAGRNMRAYYFGFTPTGCDPVDAILEAVARAGKAYHHTDQWGASNGGEPSYAEQIQRAAEHAAKEFSFAAAAYHGAKERT